MKNKKELDEKFNDMLYEEVIMTLQEERDHAQRPSYINRSIDIAIECIEKQIRKKPIKTEPEIICPTCQTSVDSDSYCQYCGQAIDWSEKYIYNNNNN